METGNRRTHQLTQSSQRCGEGEKVKRSTPYYFREGKATIWLTAGQYTRLKALMAESVKDGRNPASRMKGFGPPPRDGAHASKSRLSS